MLCSGSELSFKIISLLQCKIKNCWYRLGLSIVKGSVLGTTCSYWKLILKSMVWGPFKASKGNQSWAPVISGWLSNVHRCQMHLPMASVAFRSDFLMFYKAMVFKFPGSFTLSLGISGRGTSAVTQSPGLHHCGGIWINFATYQKCCQRLGDLGSPAECL